VGQDGILRASGTRAKPTALDAAQVLNDLRVPAGHHLEALIGDRKGQHSIRINDQYRICFTWKDGHAYDVEITKHYR
jgi:proteic killer suppression protein